MLDLFLRLPRNFEFLQGGHKYRDVIIVKTLSGIHMSDWKYYEATFFMKHNRIVSMLMLFMGF